MNPCIQSLIKLREMLASECKDLADTIICKIDIDRRAEDFLLDSVQKFEVTLKFLDQTIGRALAFKEDLIMSKYPRFVQDAIIYEEERVNQLIAEQELAICIDLQKETKTNLS